MPPSNTNTLPAASSRSATARGIVTFHAYNAAGQLERIDYSDGKTAPVIYGYDRLGRNSTVVQGNTVTTNEFTAEGALRRQSVAGGPLAGGPLAGVTLEQGYDGLGRRTRFAAGLPHGQEVGGACGQLAGALRDVPVEARPEQPVRGRSRARS